MEWDEGWVGDPPDVPPSSTMSDEHIIERLDGKDVCHGCGRLAYLDACPYDSELYGDEALVCCDSCAPGHALDI